MRKAISTLIVIGLAFGALAAPATAGKKKARVMSVRYDNPAAGSWVSGGLGINAPTLPSAANERYVSVVVEDDVNPMAGVRLRWDLDGDGSSDGFIEVCGKTEKPVQIPSGVTLDVFAYVVAGPNCPQGSAFSGTVTATFSSKP